MKQYIKYSWIVFIILTCESTLFGQKSIVHFDKDSYALTKKTKVRLDSLANLIIKEDDLSMEIQLTGFTDPDANEKYNEKLSRDRTLSVYQYFVSLGIMHQFELIHKGENNQLNSNSDENEKSINRRVEIILKKKKRNYVYDVFEEKTQVFNIDPEKDTIILCEKGTKIKIEKYIFKNTDLFKPITVEVQEYNSMNDYVLNNLTTKMPNGTFLESRGMVNLQIKQEDKELELKPGKNVDILFKDRKIDDNTKLFYGERNGENAIWHQDSSNNSSSFSYSRFGYTYTGKINIIVSSLKEARKKLNLISDWTMETINGELCKLVTYYGKFNEVSKRDTIKVANEELISELMIESNKFGLINCDRFTNNTNPRIELMVEANGIEDANIILAFDDIKAMLPYSYREGNKYYFSNIPENLNARVIGLNKSSKESEISFASKKIITEKSKPINLEFEMKSKEEIEKMMKEI